MLKLDHIQKSFDGVPVLRDITLQVPHRKIFGYDRVLT